MIKKISIVALSSILIGGCASTDTQLQTAVKVIQKAISVANGIYLFGAAAVSNYESRPPCGLDGAKLYCKDPAKAAVASKIVLELRTTIDTSQSMLDNISKYGINEATIISSLLSAGNLVISIIDTFDKD